MAIGINFHIIAEMNIYITAEINSSILWLVLELVS